MARANAWLASAALLVLLALAPQASAAAQGSQRAALMSLYDSCGGDEWHNAKGWGTTASVCTWANVQCHPTASDNVTSVQLPYNNMKCALPDLTGLTHLRTLVLSNNNITSLGDTIGNLPLWYLDVSNNPLQGLPPSFSNLTQIQTVVLTNCGLKGKLPDISRFSQLQHIFLDKNAFEGPLYSSTLVKHQQLIYMNLCYNELSGSIPEEFTHLPSLMQLWLCNNKLTGTLPNFWSDSYIHMTNLMLSGNALSGTLPALSGMNNAMRYLSLNNNRFSGTIPPSYGNFVHLESLNLANNTLIGQIPHSVGNLASLQLLDLAGNSLGGTIPQSVHKLSSLLAIDLSDNTITGTLPSSFGDSNKLLNFKVANNLLSGTIPTMFGQHLNFSSYDNHDGTIDLSFNAFCGFMPIGLANMTISSQVERIVINLSNNRLDPTVPPQLQHLCSEGPVLCKLGEQHDGSC